MAMYLDYDGIKGNVTAQGYSDMIALRYFKFNVTRKISMESGRMANRENTHPKLSSVYIEKLTDASTPALFKESVAGSKGKKVIIHFARTGTDTLTEYMTYTLENCLISKYLFFHTDLIKAPHEQIHLSYTSLQISNITRGANNQAIDTLRFGYDLVAAAKL